MVKAITRANLTTFYNVEIQRNKLIDANALQNRRVLINRRQSDQPKTSSSIAIQPIRRQRCQSISAYRGPRAININYGERNVGIGTANGKNDATSSENGMY